jgi:hypothetical protein
MNRQEQKPKELVHGNGVVDLIFLKCSQATNGSGQSQIKTNRYYLEIH